MYFFDVDNDETITTIAASGGDGEGDGVSMLALADIVIMQSLWCQFRILLVYFPPFHFHFQFDWVHDETAIAVGGATTTKLSSAAKT